MRSGGIISLTLKSLPTSGNATPLAQLTWRRLAQVPTRVTLDGRRLRRRKHAYANGLAGSTALKTSGTEDDPNWFERTPQISRHIFLDSAQNGIGGTTTDSSTNGTTTGSTAGSTTTGPATGPTYTQSPSGNTLGPNASPSGSTLTPTGPGSGMGR